MSALAERPNSWQFALRIDAVPRGLVSECQALIAGVQVVDPKELLAKAKSEFYRKRIRERWPGLDQVRVYIPLSEDMKLEDIRRIIDICDAPFDRMDFIVGLLMTGDSEYSVLPPWLLRLIRAIDCEVTVNVTYNP